MRRVVVTGLGMVTPLACGVEPTWRRLINGDSGARRIETFDVSDLPAKIACQVPRGEVPRSRSSQSVSSRMVSTDDHSAAERSHEIGIRDVTAERRFQDDCTSQRVTGPRSRCSPG